MVGLDAATTQGEHKPRRGVVVNFNPLSPVRDMCIYCQPRTDNHEHNVMSIA